MRERPGYSIFLGNLEVEVTHKKVRNLNLRIRPPSGPVVVSAPLRSSREEVRSFVASKEPWIRGHLEEMGKRGKAMEKTYENGEAQELGGFLVPLSLIEDGGRPRVVLVGEAGELSLFGPSLELHGAAGLGREKRAAALAKWYRAFLEERIPPLLSAHEARMGVKASAWSLRVMRSRWGTCNLRTRSLTFSLELAKVPPECLELVVVHELVHLLEASHNARFKSLLARELPDWKTRSARLDAFSRGRMEDLDKNGS